MEERTWEKVWPPDLPYDHSGMTLDKALAIIEGAKKKAADMGITEKTAILAGIIVPKSAGMLRYMNNNVPGVEVPDTLIDRMKSAEDKKMEGVRVTVELIEAMKKIPGVRGIHLQAIEAEEMLPGIIEKAGLLPRPEV